MRGWASPALVCVLMGLGQSLHGEPMGASGEGRWVCAWYAPPQLIEPDNGPPPPGLDGNTLRQVFRVGLGGTKQRLRFSNEYGTSDLEVLEAHCALSAGGHAIQPAMDRTLLFGGRTGAVVPAGRSVTTDPVGLCIPQHALVAVTVRFGEVPRALTGHPGSRTTSYLQAGAAAAAASMPDARSVDHWYILAEMEVEGRGGERAVAILGDSITDGRGSTTNGNDRWPDVLADRLLDEPGTRGVAVLNLGVGGNAVVRGGLGPTALSRFDRDVLERAGLRWLVVLEGVNDIGNFGPAVTQDLIRAYETFIRRAHDRGLLVYGVPILPFGGSQYTGAGREAARQTVNAWIRAPGNFDAVIDLEVVVRSPDDPSALCGAYDTGDHLHLNASGYRAMGEAVDLGLFR